MCSSPARAPAGLRFCAQPRPLRSVHALLPPRTARSQIDTMSQNTVFGLCVIFLTLAAACQHRLFLLSEQNAPAEGKGTPAVPAAAPSAPSIAPATPTRHDE